MALATTVGTPLAAVSARAQNSVQDSVKVTAQVSAQDSAQGCPGNPDALGTSRVIAIDPSDYKRLGRMQYPDSLPLNDKEVVLTFDDGPLPPHSNKILDILGSECVKATYFLVGEMARAYPAVVRRIYQEGHTIGTHSDNHPTHFGTLPIERMRHEIDGGIADVSAALGDSKYLAPFFRLPGLDRSDTVESELAARSLIVFSSDTVADDWHHGIRPNQIIALALHRLEARGKGILLLHDIHPTTVAALPGLLQALKDNGFHIVQVVPSASYMIAMAKKPETRLLASALPEQLKIGHGLDGGAVQPAWPKSIADFAPDDIALPAPDASAFEPDSGVAEDNGNVQWPAQPKAKTASADLQEPTPHGKKIAGSFRGENARERARESARESADAASSIGHHRLRPGRHHTHSRLRARAGADAHSSDVISRIKAFATVFSPAQ